MKLLMALVVQIVLGLILMWGILQAVHGSYWILAVTSLLYLALFARIGCATH